MRRILIFGNSGSGKSTLATELGKQETLAHLDLDTLAWMDSSPPQRTSLDYASGEIDQFIGDNDSWVIEGCYTDLLEVVGDKASEIIYLDLPVDLCVANARNRPWEAHKYDSKEQQDRNLEMLLEWITQYEVREDDFSRLAHSRFYDEFSGNKKKYANNDKASITL